MFGRKKQQHLSYDREKQKPALRKSICTGETTAGFKDLRTGNYHDVMLIRNDRELEECMEMYGLTETPETEY